MQTVKDFITFECISFHEINCKYLTFNLKYDNRVLG